jgi:hypothetical protein
VGAASRRCPFLTNILAPLRRGFFLLALNSAMWRDRLKFEFIGCGLMLLAFVIALGIGFFVLLANSSVGLAAAVMVVSFIAICWAADRLGG